MPLGKRDALATLTWRLGVLGIFEALARRDCLVALCYHRIGDAERSEYDPGVYSASAQQFDDQMRYLKSRFHVATLEEVLEMLQHPSKMRGPQILLTFDDGYLDNYQIALPILESHGLQATFFLPTSFVGTDYLPWWDRIAYMVRHAGEREIVMKYPRSFSVQVTQTSMNASIRTVLKAFRSGETTDSDRFMRELEEECRVTAPMRARTRLFMDWSEAADARRRGAAIGSHTHSHELLSRLTFEQQVEELEVSAKILRERLGITRDVLAYPVGTQTAFSPVTIQALQQARYDAAFSFYGGINSPANLERFNLLRINVGREMSLPHFRMKTAAATAFGRQY
jgi:peptidoglycan/xylan/chitin deacetylase (PgdA/CDA1 family)